MLARYQRTFSNDVVNDAVHAVRNAAFLSVSY